jgi:hypothetical protein
MVTGNGVPRDHAEAIDGLVVAHPSSPTADQLEHAPGAWFHAAIDRLKRDTVGYNYWVKVAARWELESNRRASDAVKSQVEDGPADARTPRGPADQHPSEVVDVFHATSTAPHRSGRGG